MRDWYRFVLVGCAGFPLLLMACAEMDTGIPDAPAQDQQFERLVEDARHEMGEGNLSQAARLYDAALAMKRDDPGLWVDIADLRFRGGEHEGALQAADSALQLDPQFAPALLKRTQFVRDAHGLAAALPWFERALEQHPGNVDLLAEYAATLGDMGRHRDMLIAVRKLAEIDPREPRVHYLQAVLAARANDPVLASSLLKRSGMRDSGVPSAIMLGALIDMQQGNFDNAATELGDLLEMQPGNSRVTDLFARAMWLNGRDREIVDRFAETAAGSNASPYLVMLVGRSLERLGKRAAAAPLLERAQAVQSGGLTALPARDGNPRKLPEQVFAMRRFVNFADTGDAQRYSDELLADFGGSSDVRVLVGDAALARGDATNALDQYSRAARIRRPWPLTRKIIYAYRKVGDTDAADTLLLRYLNAEPRNTEALIMQAQRSASDEDWLRVAMLLDAAITFGAGNDLVLLDLRLRAARELGDTGTAQRIAMALDNMRGSDFVSH